MNRSICGRMRIAAITVVILAGCGRDENARGGKPCPGSAQPAALPNTVQATFLPMELRLPVDSFRRREIKDPAGHAEGWSGRSGLAVSYTAQAGLVRMRDLSFGDSRVVNCTEEIDGRQTQISMFYSRTTTAPGQRVLAVWTLGDRQTVVVRAFHPDAGRRDELLSIVQSVRFKH